MKKNLKTQFSWLVVSVMLMVLIPTSTWALEPEPAMAPLNPDFIKYCDDLEAGSLNTASIDGYSGGYIPPPFKPKPASPDTVLTQEKNFPETFDLRTLGRVPPVRNQKPYGSCWAFAAVASLETYLSNEEEVDLSENNMMLNHGFDWGPDDGGNANMAAAYLTRYSGPIRESDDPYGSVKKTDLPPLYHIQEAKWLSDSSATIKQALMDGGALYDTMYSRAFTDEKYFNKELAAFYYDGSESSDHSISIIGWDDNFSRENFNTIPPSDGAWIIHNSWGDEVLDGGYFYMSYHDTYAGSDVTAFHNAESTDNYDRIYQYDPLGLTSAIGYPYEDSAWAANVFLAQANENLKAVSTCAVTADTTIDINVYTGLSDDQPNSGHLRLSQTVTFENAGYYTIELDRLVPLVAGEKFSIVMKYQNSGSEHPIPIENPIENYSSQATANPLESFISYDGHQNWRDISQKADTNVCIKAFTDDPSPSASTSYRTHVENEGWQDWKNNGEMSGSSGQSRRLEAIAIKTDSPDYDLGIKYKSHIENLGWEKDYQEDGSPSGTSGQSLRLEAIQIDLTGSDAKNFDIYYRVHAENLGWLDWAKNNTKAGSTGFGYRLEGIEILIQPKGSSAPGPEGRPFVEND